MKQNKSATPPWREIIVCVILLFIFLAVFVNKVIIKDEKPEPEPPQMENKNKKPVKNKTKSKGKKPEKPVGEQKSSVEQIEILKTLIHGASPYFEWNKENKEN